MIARKSLLVFANNVVGAVLGLIALKLTSVYLGPRVIGTFDAAVGFLGLLFFVTDLGFHSAHMKRVSEGMNARDCLTTFAVFKAATTALFVGVSLAAIFWRVVVMDRPLQDATPAALVVAAAYLAVKSLAAIPGSTFDARRETARGQMMPFLETIVRVGVTIPVALLIGAVLRGAGPLAGSAVAESAFALWLRDYPAAAFGLTWTLGAAAGAAVGLFYLPSSTRFGRFRWDILRSYWTYALPIFLVAGVHTVSTYVDKAALAYFWSDLEVGRYSQPRRITAFFEAIPMAVLLLLFPTVSALHAARRNDEIASTLGRAERYIGMVVFPVVAVLVVYAEAIVRVLLSAEWLGAVWTLRWLAVYSLFIALTRPNVALLLGMNMPGVAARIGVAMAAANIVLVLLLVPPSLRAIPVPLPGLADVGAAVASAVSGVVGFLLFRRAAREALGPRPLRPFLAHAGAAVAAGAVLALLPVLLLDGPMRVWHLVVFSGLGGLVYAALLWLVGELTREDLRIFRETLSPRQMAGYVRDELRR